MFVDVSLAGKSEVIFPLGKQDVDSFIEKIKDRNPKSLGFNPKNLIVSNDNSEGSSSFGEKRRRDKMWLYNIDINNDGRKEFFIIYTGSGTLSGSGILNVFTKELRPIEIGKIISKSLWSDDSGDLSKLHLWLAAPAIVKRNGNYFIRFRDQKPGKAPPLTGSWPTPAGGSARRAALYATSI